MWGSMNDTQQRAFKGNSHFKISKNRSRGLSQPSFSCVPSHGPAFPWSKLGSAHTFAPQATFAPPSLCPWGLGLWLTDWHTGQFSLREERKKMCFAVLMGSDMPTGSIGPEECK
jgi:hypothetical protein